MCDPDQVGFHALDWEEVTAYADFARIYCLAEDFAVPFDPDHAWPEGDTDPRRVLRDIALVGDRIGEIPCHG